MLEILISISILSVLVGYGVLNARSSMTRARVENAASRLSFQLQQAKSAALSGNRTVFVDLNQDTNELTIWIDENRDDVRDPGEEEEVELEGPGRVTLDSSWTSGLFNSYGQFLTSVNQRTIRTHTTRIRSADGAERQIVTIRGSGSISRDEA